LSGFIGISGLNGVETIYCISVRERERG